MIIRTWRARAAANRAHLYPRHFAEVVLPRLEALPGFAGAYLLRRNLADEVEFVVQTQWDSHDAIARFAGPTPDVAVVDSAAEATLSAYDATVSHYDVLVSPATRAGQAT